MARRDVLVCHDVVFSLVVSRPSHSRFTPWIAVVCSVYQSVKLSLESSVCIIKRLLWGRDTEREEQNAPIMSAPQTFVVILKYCINAQSRTEQSCILVWINSAFSATSALSVFIHLQIWQLYQRFCLKCLAATDFLVWLLFISQRNLIPLLTIHYFLLPPFQTGMFLACIWGFGWLRGCCESVSCTILQILKRNSWKVININLLCINWEGAKAVSSGV